MVWDTASTYNLYLATPLGHIERNLLFHTLFRGSMLIFKCISIFSGTGVCLKIRRPPQPNTSNVRVPSFCGPFVFAPPFLSPCRSLNSAHTNMYWPIYLHSGSHQKCSSPTNGASFNLLLFSFVKTDPSIDPFIKSNPPIPSLQIRANQVNLPSSIRLLTWILHWIALILLTWLISIYIIYF